MTKRGWWKAPIRFFPRGWLMPVLPPDGGVDLRQQRGGELDDGQAAQQRGRGETAEVADDAPAERDERRPTLDPRYEQPIPGRAQGREALVLLAVVDLDDERVEPGRPERVQNRPAVERAHALAGQQTAAACVPQRGQSRANAGEDAGPHQDGVRAIA